MIYIKELERSIEMRLFLRPALVPQNSDFDILYYQLNNALLFTFSGFDKEMILTDQVLHENKKAGEIFDKKGGIWIMKTDSLPGDLCIKAIAVSTSMLMLETAPIDQDKVQDLLQELDSVTYRRSGNSSSFKLRGKNLIRVSGQKKVSNLAPRVLWTIKWRELEEEQRLLAIEIADLVYRYSCYSFDGLKIEEVEAWTAPNLQMKVQLKMIQRFELEQRPMLTIGLHDRQTQTLEIRQLLSLQQTILAMNIEELNTYVAEHLDTPERQAKILHILTFVMAGRVKRANDKLTWKEARKIARKLVQKSY